MDGRLADCEETTRLRRALGNLAALTSLPALWSNASERGIATGLADAIMGVQDLAAVSIRLEGRDHRVIKVERFAPKVPDHLPKLLAPLSGARPGQLGEGTLTPEGGYRVCVVGIGLGGASRLHAVSSRPDFPSEAERLELVIAANQAAVALERAGSERALREQSKLLEQERATIAALNVKLSHERDRLSRLFQQAPGFLAVLRGPDHVFELANDSYMRLVGGRPLVGRTARDAFPELEGQGFLEKLDEVYATGFPFVANSAPVDLRRPDQNRLERVFLDFIYQPIMDDAGAVAGILVEGHDVTEQTVAAEHRQLLLNELNHRVKNTLATVQSVAHQTLSRAESLAEARAQLTARILALSNAHNVLTRGSWRGARLEEIVSEALRPHDDLQHSRISISGSAVWLDARPALALAMALHELATNAVKYGALSNDVGQVSISWTEEGGGSVRLEWRERGGPPVRSPGRRGFGTRLLQSGLAHELGGGAEISFAAAGVVAVLRLPIGGAKIEGDAPERRSDAREASQSELSVSAD